MSTQAANNEVFYRDHYTYFLIPFGYRLDRSASGQGNALSYHSDPYHASHLDLIDDIQKSSKYQAKHAREKYLLHETQLTLFNRAKWFRLKHEQQDIITGCLQYDYNQGKYQYRCHFKAVIELVLFEYRDPAKRSNTSRTESRGDWPIQPQQVGILLCAVTLADQIGGTNQQRLDHLVNFNERMRMLDAPTYDAIRSEVTAKLGTFDLKDAPHLFWQKLLHDSSVCIDGHTWYLKLQSIPSQNQGEETTDYPDDRAFVYTFACMSGPPPVVDLTSPDEKHRAWQRAWFALLDVDGCSTLRGTGALSAYERQWLYDHTYRRWLEKGSLYGFTDFSAALLAQAGKAYASIYSHFRQMYLDQLLLLLYERAVLFRFSNAISAFSHDYNNNPTAAGLQFHDLCEQFMLMTNLYQFPMFTTQQQGLEMYAQARESLDIDDLYREVATEIQTTDAYFSQLSDDTRNRQLARIQMVGLPLAVLAIIFGLLQVLEGAQQAGWLLKVVAVLLVIIALVSESLLQSRRWLGRLIVGSDDEG